MLALALIDDVRSAWERNQDTFWPQILVFISLTVQGLGLALMLGMPAGIILTRRSARLANPLIAFLGLVQTIPSLVLLGVLISIPVFGLGQRSALVAAVIYSLFPVVLNTYVGITQVAAAVRDAARGMGMTGRQILWHVELPLAFPTILAGVRAGAIYTSSMIVVGGFVGAGGLGDYIVTGLSRADSGLIWLGAGPILVITLLLFWFLGRLAWLAQKNSTLGMSLGGAIIVGLSAFALYGLAERVLEKFGSAPESRPIRIGAKDFTEGRILAEIVKETLAAHTDLPVEVVPNLGTTLILNALKSGELDLYPEYTGVLLTSKEALDMSVPADTSTITSLVRDKMRSRYGLILLETFGLNNTYAPCVTQETSRKHRLKKISDLQRTPRLRVVVDLSFLDRPDGWRGLVRKYDLHFDQSPQQVGPDLLYRALEYKEADLIIGFATDWQIQKLKLVILQDDRSYFPSYHAAPLVRADTLERHPEIAAVLNRLGGKIDDDAMRTMNYQVAVEKRSELEVARAFLRRRGIIREPEGAAK